MTPQLRPAARRRLVVATNSELQERGLLKHARITQSVTAALRERGTDELTARLGAEMGMLAFSVAFERWMETNDNEPFSPFADAAMSDLQARAAEIVLPSRAAPQLFKRCYVADESVIPTRLDGTCEQTGAGRS